jgi:hypothetical protein
MLRLRQPVPDIGRVAKDDSARQDMITLKLSGSSGIRDGFNRGLPPDLCRRVGAAADTAQPFWTTVRGAIDTRIGSVEAVL